MPVFGLGTFQVFAIRPTATGLSAWAGCPSYSGPRPLRAPEGRHTHERVPGTGVRRVHVAELGPRPLTRVRFVRTARAASGNLTVGTPDATALPELDGLCRLDAITGTAGEPNDADAGITVSLSDVRCTAGVSPCGPRTARAARHTGELRATSEIRVTDRLGGSATTMQDIPFPVAVPCGASPQTDEAACAVTTSANTVVPGAVKEVSARSCSSARYSLRRRPRREHQTPGTPCSPFRVSSSPTSA